MELFHEVDPAGAATRDQRQRARALEQPALELGGFLDDRQVGTEVGVEHRLEAHPAQRSVDLAGQVGTEREAEGLSDRDANGGGDLHHAIGVRILQLVPDIDGLVIFDDSPGRAMGRALATAHARRIGQGDITRRCDAGLEATVEEAQRPDVLVLLADRDAATAQHAFARIEHDASGGGIERQIGNDARQLGAGHAEVGGKRLQLAILVPKAAEALVRVPRQRQFQDATPHFDDFRRLGQNIHALVEGRAARAQHPAGVLHLNDANAAGTRRFEIRMLAERRNLHMGLACRVQDGGSRSNLHGHAVNRCFDHVCHFDHFSISENQASAATGFLRRSVNSELKCFSADNTGFGAVCPSAQSEPFCMAWSDHPDVRDILLSAVSGDDLVEKMQHLRTADAAGCALAAGLVDAEIEIEARKLDDTVMVINDDETAGSHHRAELLQMLIGNRRVELALGNHAAGWTAGPAHPSPCAPYQYRRRSSRRSRGW